jgi:hypothetical protein
VFGWEGDSLQKAMDNRCNLNHACPEAGLTVQSPFVYNTCTRRQQAIENIDGCKKPLRDTTQLHANKLKGSWNYLRETRLENRSPAHADSTLISPDNACLSTTTYIGIAYTLIN